MRGWSRELCLHEDSLVRHGFPNLVSCLHGAGMSRDFSSLWGLCPHGRSWRYPSCVPSRFAIAASARFSLASRAVQNFPETVICTRRSFEYGQTSNSGMRVIQLRCGAKGRSASRTQMFRVWCTDERETKSLQGHSPEQAFFFRWDETQSSVLSV